MLAADKTLGHETCLVFEECMKYVAEREPCKVSIPLLSLSHYEVSIS